MELIQDQKKKNRVLVLGEDVTQDSVREIIRSIYELNMEKVLLERLTNIWFGTEVRI